MDRIEQNKKPEAIVSMLPNSKLEKE